MTTDLTELAFTRLGPKYSEPRPIQSQLLRQLVEEPGENELRRLTNGA